MVTLGTRVKVWVECNRGIMRQVGSGYIRVMGMGKLEVQSEAGNNTYQFELKDVVLEVVHNDLARPLFI